MKPVIADSDREKLLRACEISRDPKLPAIQRAQEQVRNLPPELAESLFHHEASRPIVEVLQAVRPFAQNGILVQVPNGFSGFNSLEAGAAISRRLSRGASPHEALAWLEKILSTERASGIGILVLSGVSASVPIVISPRVSIVPFEAVPHSFTKSWVQESFSNSFRILQSRHLPPRAAVLCTYEVQPFLHHTSDGDPPAQSDPLAVQTLLDDVRLALTLVGPSCPTTVGYWSQFDDPDLNDALAYQGVSSSIEEVLPWGLSPPTPLDPAESLHVTSAFLALPDPLKERIRLALRRLNQALRRPAHGDRALDLAIALESLLTDDEEAGELRFKLSLRAALTLGGSTEDRVKTRRAVRALYDLRSKIVHTGRTTSRSPQTVSATSLEASVLCARVIRTIVDWGKLPNWTELEVSSGAHPA
jgi:hypothetical protein